MKLKKSQSSRGLGLGLALAGLSCAFASACGDSKDGSLLDMQGHGGSANGDAGADSGIHLMVGGDANGLGNGGDGSNLGEGGGCGSTKIVANPLLVNVLLVVDKSLSMEDKPAGFAINKWTALSDALASTLEQTQDKIRYGLDLYPYSGKSGGALASSCQMPSTTAPVVVPVQDGVDAAPLILAALDKNPPSGATPTAAALTRALIYYTTGAGKSLEGAKYVLLATDGGPNCNGDLSCTAEACTACLDHPESCGAGTNLCDPKTDKDGAFNCLDDTDSVSAVAELTKAGIQTIVVGIPGTEAYVDTLNALATASGVTNPDAPPDYFAVSAKAGAEGLAEALGHITTGLVRSCELHLEEEPPDRENLFVVIDDADITRDDPDGWTIPDPDPTHTPPVIEITGALCEKIKTEGVEYINVSYGCPDHHNPVK
jgi:hypothetical protein